MAILQAKAETDGLRRQLADRDREVTMLRNRYDILYLSFAAPFASIVRGTLPAQHSLTATRKLQVRGLRNSAVPLDHRSAEYPRIGGGPRPEQPPAVRPGLGPASATTECRGQRGVVSVAGPDGARRGAAAAGSGEGGATIDIGGGAAGMKFNGGLSRTGPACAGSDSARTQLYLAIARASTSRASSDRTSSARLSGA